MRSNNNQRRGSDELQATTAAPTKDYEMESMSVAPNVELTRMPL
jgi:hypothetical protein